MSLPTFDTARDEILGLFRTAWNAGAGVVNGGPVPEVHWPDVARDAPPPSNAPWARITIRHTTGEQSTFGKTGERRFTNRGLVTVQIFTPISAGGGATKAEKFAIIARDAYRGVGTPSGIWFRGVTIREIPPDATWNQMNVTAEFEYDELQ